MAAGLGAGLASRARGDAFEEGIRPTGMPTARADSVIMIWLPGGMPQTDMWDPKEFTPYNKGMKGSDLLGTCPLIPTAVDDLFFGEGLETIASVMDKGSVVRSVTNPARSGAQHLKAQHYMKTGYMFPPGFKAPSMGSVIARTLGRIDPHVPAYIDIGRDINAASDNNKFIDTFQGPGFLGINYAPFVIHDARRGMATLEIAAGMTEERFNARQRFLHRAVNLDESGISGAPKAQEYIKVMNEARAMMDSPVKEAFLFREREPESVLSRYDTGGGFGPGCLLARRLVERGARYVEVKIEHVPFGGFDTHDKGQSRIVDMKRRIDRPIGQLIRELDERGLLETTLVIIATEFGRTIADKQLAGLEEEGFVEDSTGEGLVVEHIGMYGFHGHFSRCSSMLFFGGGIREGLVYGRTADRHPMIAVEDPAPIIDLHATIYTALGIAPDVYYVTEGRPVYVTEEGKGKAIDALFS